MATEEESGISFIGIFPKKQREMIAQYSNSIVTSRIESQHSNNSHKKTQQSIEEEEEEGKCCKSKCTCCIKVKNFFTSVYKIVQSNIGLLLLLGAYVSCGALIFSYLEREKDGELRKQLNGRREEFLENVELLYTDLQSLSEEQQSFDSNVSHFNSTVGNDTIRMKLKKLLQAHEDFLSQLPAQIIKYYSSTVMKDWSFYESLFFCGTVITTIGYGNVTPATGSGRIATMIFGCFGIPLGLIFLSRTGKNLTKAIKFLWSFIRRFYYTGSCRRVRRMVPLSRMKMSVCQRLNSYFKSNRKSKSKDLNQSLSNDIENQEQPLQQQISFIRQDTQRQQSGQSKAEEDTENNIVPYEVDDNFNLPPVIALAIAFFYICLGAFIYTRWENWSYLDSFYFTFISLSTIGFGDITPDHPKFFLASFIYILLGLSLIAMVINVIMEAVNDTITRARDSVFNFRKRIKSAVPTLTKEFRLERRMSV